MGADAEHPNERTPEHTEQTEQTRTPLFVRSVVRLFGVKEIKEFKEIKDKITKFPKLPKFPKFSTDTIQWLTVTCKIIEKIFAKILDKGVLIVLYLWLEFHKQLSLLVVLCSSAYTHNLLIDTYLYEYNYASRCSG